MVKWLPVLIEFSYPMAALKSRTTRQISMATLPMWNMKAKPNIPNINPSPFLIHPLVPFTKMFQQLPRLITKPQYLFYSGLLRHQLTSEHNLHSHRISNVYNQRHIIVYYIRYFLYPLWSLFNFLLNSSLFQISYIRYVKCWKQTPTVIVW